MNVCDINWVGMNVYCLHILAAIMISKRLVITGFNLNNNIDKNLSFVEEILWSTSLLKPW